MATKLPPQASVPPPAASPTTTAPRKQGVTARQPKTAEEKAAAKAAKRAALDAARAALPKVPKKKAPPVSAWNREDPLVIDDVFMRWSECSSLDDIAKEYEVAKATVYGLIAAPEHADRYARAKDYRAEVLAAGISDIGDKVLKGKYDPNAARVAIDAYKWSASKLKPKTYGDKIEFEGKVEIGLADALKNLSHGQGVSDVTGQALVIPSHAALPGTS